MYRQDRTDRDMADFMPEPQFQPNLINFKEPLELKDQHLVALANSNGFLAGRITELEKANYRLEEQNRRLNRDNKELRERNTELERRDSAAQAGYKSGQQLVDEIEAAIKGKKETKN